MHTRKRRGRKIHRKTNQYYVSYNNTLWRIQCLDTNIYVNIHFLCKLYSFLGTEAHEKLKGALTNTRIVNDIRKLSPVDQTSCLEGFHATLNHWHPKMLVFSWMGTYCRCCRYKIIWRCTVFYQATYNIGSPMDIEYDMLLAKALT